MSVLHFTVKVEFGIVLVGRVQSSVYSIERASDAFEIYWSIAVFFLCVLDEGCLIL